MSATSTKTDAENEPSPVRYGQWAFSSVKITIYGPDDPRFQLPKIDDRLHIAVSERSVQAGVRHVVYGNRQADRRQVAMVREHGIDTPAESSALGAIAGGRTSISRPGPCAPMGPSSAQRRPIQSGTAYGRPLLGSAHRTDGTEGGHGSDPSPGASANAQPGGTGRV